MVDQGSADDKIIGVHADDPIYRDFSSIDELPKHLLAEIKNFFKNYKELEGSHVVVDNFKGRDNALKIITDAVHLYKEHFRS